MPASTAHRPILTRIPPPPRIPSQPLPPAHRPILSRIPPPQQLPALSPGNSSVATFLSSVQGGPGLFFFQPRLSPTLETLPHNRPSAKVSPDPFQTVLYDSRAPRMVQAHIDRPLPKAETAGATGIPTKQPASTHLNDPSKRNPSFLHKRNQQYFFFHLNILLGWPGHAPAPTNHHSPLRESHRDQKIIRAPSQLHSSEERGD